MLQSFADKRGRLVAQPGHRESERGRQSVWATWSDNNPKAVLMERKRAAIVAAARQAFLENGYAQTSMDRVNPIQGWLRLLRRRPNSMPREPKTLRCTNNWKSKQNAAPSCSGPRTQQYKLPGTKSKFRINTEMGGYAHVRNHIRRRSH